MSTLLTPRQTTLSEEVGLYAAFRLDETVAKALHDWARESGIPNLLPLDKMHATTVCSSTPVEGYKVEGTFDKPLEISPDSFLLVLTKSPRTGKTVLFLHFDCPEIDRKHEDADHHGAAPQPFKFTPHITLSYDVGDFSPHDITPPCSPLRFVEEYAEPFVQNWEQKSGCLNAPAPRAPALVPG